MAAIKSWWNKNVTGEASTPTGGPGSAGEQKASPSQGSPPPYSQRNAGRVGESTARSSPATQNGTAANRSQKSISFGSALGGSSKPDMDKIRAIVKQESERRMAGFRQQMVDVTSQRDQLALQLRETQAELKGLQAIQKLQSQEQASGASNDKAKDQLRGKLEESNMKLAMQLSKTEELEERLATTTRERDEANRNASAMAEMEEDLQKQFSETVRLNRTRIEELETLLADARKRESIDAAFGAAAAESQNSTEEAMHLKEELEKTQKALASATREASAYETSLRTEMKTEHTRQLDAVRAECKEQASASMNQLEAELKAVKAALSNMNEERKHVELETQKLRDSSDSMRKDLERAHRQELESHKAKFEVELEKACKKAVNHALDQERQTAAELSKDLSTADAVEAALTLERAAWAEKANAEQLLAVEKALEVAKLAEVDAIEKALIAERKVAAEEAKVRETAAVAAAISKMSSEEETSSTETLSMLKAQIKQMTEDYAEANSRLSTETLEAQSAVEVLQKSEETKVAEIQHLEKQLEDARRGVEEAKSNAKDNVTAAIARAKLECKENQTLEIEKMKAEHSRSLEEALSKASAETQNQLQIAKAKLIETQTELAQAKSELLEATADVDKGKTLAQKEMATAAADAAQKMAQLQSEYEEALANAATSLKENKGEEKVQELQASLSRMTDEVDRTADELMQAEARASAAEAVSSSIKAQLAKSQLELSRAQAELAETVVTLDDAKAESSRLRERIAAVEAREAAAAVEQVESAEKKLAKDEAEAEAAKVASAKIEALQKELVEKEMALDKARASSMRAEQALHEALDASEAEVKKIHAQASEDSKRAVESTLAEAEREYESMLELEREKWQAHAERDRSEAILNTRKEIETRAKVELDKTLAFWRNTWSMEKDRAIEEALEGGREEARQEVAAERDEALRAARREWEQETSRAVATALREAERKAEVALDAEIAKHAAEMSALNSAYAVARELQLETKGLLEESEAKYRDSQAELVELQENFGLHGAKGEALVAGLKHAKAELIRMKSQLSAIRKECGAFSTRKAPQIAELARVMNLWNQDTKWNEYDSSRDPTPNCSLDDPVIKHLLMNWTQDKQKLQLLRKWLKHVLSGRKVDQTRSFRPGVELTKLPTEVCEGFLRMIVPMIRSRDDIDIQAFYRTRRETWRDLRLRVGPRGTLEPFHRRQQAQLAQQQAQFVSSQLQRQARVQHTPPQSSPSSVSSPYGNPFASPNTTAGSKDYTLHNNLALNSGGRERRGTTSDVFADTSHQTPVFQSVQRRRSSWSSQSQEQNAGQKRLPPSGGSGVRARVNLNQINSRLSKLRKN